MPGPADREIVNSVIYNELCVGTIQKASRDYYKRVIRSLIDDGAEGIILGCTEIGLLIKQEDADVPLFDKTAIHAIEAVKMALEE